MLDLSSEVRSPDEGRREDGGGKQGGDHTQKAHREGRLDLRNSWQVVAGAMLIPLGVVFILIGWYGTAHARVVQQQIPYMVSACFVGSAAWWWEASCSGDDTGCTASTTRPTRTTRSNSRCSS